MQKTVFSGIQPTAIPTLGNYLGALKNWAELCSAHRCFYAVVDMHAITVRQDPKVLNQRMREVFALIIASGMENATLYIQSHVSAHAELSWILNSFTMFGELSRMTQFKDKSQKHADNINAGLFTYPVLQAADILLFNTHFVPIGADQKQHVELSRDIAGRFNGIYGDVFTLPEPLIPKAGARIMSLSEPHRKMDKSDPNPAGYISMLDPRDTILKKFKRAVTDSGGDVRYEPEEKRGVSNLMTIYSICKGEGGEPLKMEEIEQEFSGLGYGAFKTAVGEAVDARLAPIREKALELLDNPVDLDRLMKQNAEIAEAAAAPMLKKVKEAIGFIIV